jgi:hypothetical protein
MGWFLVLFPMIVIALRPLLPSPSWFPGLPWLLSVVILVFGFAVADVCPLWEFFWFLFFGAAAIVGLMWARNSQ